MTRPTSLLLLVVVIAGCEALLDFDGVDYTGDDDGQGGGLVCDQTCLCCPCGDGGAPPGC